MVQIRLSLTKSRKYREIYLKEKVAVKLSDTQLQVNAVKEPAGHRCGMWTGVCLGTGVIISAQA